MNLEFIAPFVSSTVNVLRTMAATDLKVGKIAIKESKATDGVVTGIIGMASKEVSGNMVLSFDKPAILGIVKRMLMEDHQEIDNDVVDAVGELTNIICGGAKSELSKNGYVFDMATPVVILGEHVEIKQLADAPPLAIPFYTQDGKFVVEANLTAK